MSTGPLIPAGASELRGRRSECDVLDTLVDAVRAGESRALVIRGEPEMGKTSLLDHVAEQASACTIVRGTGVESEMELAFAVVHQLLSQMLDRLDHLPRFGGELTASSTGPICDQSGCRATVALDDCRHA
jgi:AAA ATPase domain